MGQIPYKMHWAIPLVFMWGSFDTRIDSAKVRGLDPSSYVDGLRYNYGYYNTVRIHPYALENIEVLKGPSATLYGQGDLGGIVNMNSKMPKAEQQGEVWAQYGSHNRKQLGVDVTGPVDEDGQLLYRFVGITRDSDTQVDHVNDDSFLIMPSLTWRISDDTNLSVLFTRQKTDSVVSTQFLPSVGTLYDGPLGHIDTDTFVGEPGWDRYDTEMTSFTTMFDHRFNDSWTFSAVARYLESQSWTREHWVDIPSIPAADGTVNRTIYTVDKEVRALNFDARLEGMFDVGMTNHTFVVGVDRQEATYEEDNYFYGTGLGGTINVYNPQYGNLQSGVISYSNPDDNRIEQTGVYVADSMEIGPVVISAALRHDWAKNISLAETGPDTESNEKVNTGRIGLMYRFDNGISPYASYTEAFVMNLGTDGAGGTLEPTTGVQREYGVKYLSDDRSLAITAAYFDITQQNRVEQGSTPGAFRKRVLQLMVGKFRPINAGIISKRS
ncbi:TonB-dependent siderophore receptor [Methylophaga marina]|uniref:TonB-dependent siderophore receptor n=1 Tax=Methylophaga marina TaxID=45495 RepID=UPI003305BDB6